MPDARRLLTDLNKEWSGCTECELGKRREALGHKFVAGGGITRGIMFIGEGPGKTEEQFGEPFVGKSGQLLRDVLNKLQFTDFYVTNLVTCRACEPVMDGTTGLPVMKRGGKEMLLRDAVPLPKQIEACRPRLLEEIYIVDPILIVTLGGLAAEAVLQRHVTITRERGRAVQASIPGWTRKPVVTEKKQVWGRKVHGQYVLPTEDNEVHYTVLPTLHPAYVLRKLQDGGANSPRKQFVEDIRKAVRIYERYLLEGMGVDLHAELDADLSDVGMEYEESEEAGS